MKPASKQEIKQESRHASKQPMKKGRKKTFETPLICETYVTVLIMLRS